MFYEVLAKSALNKVLTASDMRFGWTINQMRGCLHQRTYCVARPTHEFLDLDVGKDFDTQIIVKVNIAEVVAKELSRPSAGQHPAAFGANTGGISSRSGALIRRHGLARAMPQPMLF
jgi:DNA repair photolyase